jgi:hypothetical protein
MPSVRLVNPTYGELMKLSGKIQEIYGTKVSAASSIHYLLLFASENQEAFIKLVKSRKVFPESYPSAVDEMRSKGLPVSKDLFNHK